MVNNDKDDPFDPKGGTKPDFSCTLRTQNQCIEDCVCKMISAHQQNPPWYSTGPMWGGGNMCTDANAQVLITCTPQCPK